MCGIVCRLLSFQSTPSTRRATAILDEYAQIKKISIHALHAEGDAGAVPRSDQTGISIHALHAEGDLDELDHNDKAAIISIHALHAEGDPPI